MATNTLLVLQGLKQRFDKEERSTKQRIEELEVHRQSAMRPILTGEVIAFQYCTDLVQLQIIAAESRSRSRPE